MGQFTSNSITLNVGAPQVCVLSPLLYSLYTHDSVSSQISTSIVTFSDDTVVLQLQVPRCKHLRGPDMDCTHPNTGQESQAKTVPSATAEEIQGLTSNPENFLFRCHRKCTDSVHLMALFHCMVRHGTVRYGSLLGGFPLGTVPGTWYFFSTTSAGVPSDPYRYQNVTCKLC